jgi:hypothetical protein
VSCQFYVTHQNKTPASPVPIVSPVPTQNSAWLRQKIQETSNKLEEIHGGRVYESSSLTPNVETWAKMKHRRTGLQLHHDAHGTDVCGYCTYNSLSEDAATRACLSLKNMDVRVELGRAHTSLLGGGSVVAHGRRRHTIYGS